VHGLKFLRAVLCPKRGSLLEGRGGRGLRWTILRKETLCRRTLLVIEGNVFLSEGLAGH